MNTKVIIKTLNLFYHIPFPVISISFGIGYGILTPSTKVTKTQTGVGSNNSSTELSLPITEIFVRIGLPYFNTLEFHIGYHAFASTSVYRNKNNLSFNQTSSINGIDFKKKDYSGGMMTVGFELAF